MLDELQTKSAAGDLEAQFQLAQILQHGLGVPMDEAWLRLVSIVLRPVRVTRCWAQYALGRNEIYMEGRITPQDLVQAHVWFSTVRDGGGTLSNAAENSCEYLRTFMSAEQIAEAIELTGGR